MPKRFDSLNSMLDLLKTDGFVVNGEIPVSQEEYDWYVSIFPPQPTGEGYDSTKWYFQGYPIVVKEI